MAQQEFKKVVRQTMAAGFLKALIERLADEQNPFDMKVRRVERGTWQVDLLTTEKDFEYFRNLLADPLKW